MSDALRDILLEEGFQLIGRLGYRLHLTAWWNPVPDRLLQILVVNVGDNVLIKGDKSYHLKSVSADGETWARDIGLLHDYLEAHFPEIRVSFSHFRDVPPALADAEVRRRLAIDSPTLPIPSVEQLVRLQRELGVKQSDLASTDDLLALSANRTDLLTGYVHQRSRAKQAEIGRIQTDLQRQRERYDLLAHLQREYQRKGSAAVYSLSVSSNLHVVDEPERFGDTVRAVVKELADHHRYQVQQKLQGGRLNVQLAEADEPAITWIEQWLGGALSPTQLERLAAPCEALRDAARSHAIVTPDEPIVVDEHVRHGEKHLAARFVSTTLARLDKTEDQGQHAQFDAESISADMMPLRVGVRVDDANRSIGPAVFPLTQMMHACVSGTTGSGKSFFARAIVEEASLQEGLNVLVLDPRNQFVGLLVPEDRPNILRQYDQFGMQVGQARGFAFNYYAPALAYASSLPDKLSSLADGRRIMSFKGMNDRDRCTLAAQVLDAVFAATSSQESERPRLLVVVDEAQLLTRKRVDESAKDAAAQSERALDTLAREGRKYGIQLVMVTQSFMTFSHELVSLRQMTTTKVFFRNSDREIDYAADIIGDGRALVQLPTAVAVLHNATWGLHRIRVRPPYSKVYELSESQIRQLFGAGAGRIQSLSSDARKLYAVLQQHGAPPNPPLNLSQAAAMAGITSKRKLQELICDLEQAGVIHTRSLPERGRPRVIELTGGRTDATDWPRGSNRTKKSDSDDEPTTHPLLAKGMRIGARFPPGPNGALRS